MGKSQGMRLEKITDKPFQKAADITHYVSDGSGRDHYVTVSSGGLHRGTKSGEKSQMNSFIDNLR